MPGNVHPSERATVAPLLTMSERTAGSRVAQSRLRPGKRVLLAALPGLCRGTLSCPPAVGSCEDVQVTVFQSRVYAAARQIPSGEVTTYKLLADHLGCRSYRAVGQALRRNPFAPEVPCHRVIASNLGLGGFGGHTRGAEIARKQELLAGEGVVFEEGRLADSSRIFNAFGTS